MAAELHGFSVYTEWKKLSHTMEQGEKKRYERDMEWWFRGTEGVVLSGKVNVNTCKENTSSCPPCLRDLVWSGMKWSLFISEVLRSNSNKGKSYSVSMWGNTREGGRHAGNLSSTLVSLALISSYSLKWHLDQLKTSQIFHSWGNADAIPHWHWFS